MLHKHRHIVPAGRGSSREGGMEEYKLKERFTAARLHWSRSALAAQIVSCARLWKIIFRWGNSISIYAAIAAKGALFVLRAPRRVTFRSDDNPSNARRLTISRDFFHNVACIHRHTHTFNKTFAFRAHARIYLCARLYIHMRAFLLPHNDCWRQVSLLMRFHCSCRWEIMHRSSFAP